MAADNNSQLASAKALAFYTIKLLIQDVKDLIAIHVKKSIRRNLNDTDTLISELSQERKTLLARWEKSNFPLTWDTLGSEKGAYESLLIILNTDPSQKWLQRLTHSSDRLTYFQLASLLVAFATSSRPQVRAPIVSNGYFCTALPLGIKLMERFKPFDEPLSEFATKILATMFRKMHIHFLPWHPDATRVGATPRAVKADWWMIIDRNTTQDSIARNCAIPETSTSVAVSRAAEDLSAPWKLTAKLRDMGTLWKKTTLPNDWNTVNASLENARATAKSRYVAETYDYVEANYDGTNWRHHMALVWAILFSHVVPCVSHKKPTSYPNGSSSKEITKMVRDIPWIKADVKKRGVTDPQPYITMVSTTIMALRDPKSPLSMQAGKNKNALGNAWTYKHGTKEITPFNMIRMGLARAESYAVIERPCWKSNWRFYTDAEVKPIYDRVMNNLLNCQPYGEFLAIEEIFGRKIAETLAKNGEVVEPPHSRVQATQVQKRKATVYMGNEGDDSNSRGKRRAIELSSDDE